MGRTVGTLVGAVVGGVVGYFAGDPYDGAVYGAEIGGAIGSAVGNKKIVTEGPRLSDLRTSFSSNGVFIPRVYVHAGGIGGNFIDASPLVEASKQIASSSGKGGPTAVNKNFSYSASFRLRICANPLGTLDVLRIYANGNLIFTRAMGADAASLIATQDLIGQIIVYQGKADQLPDPTEEALHGIGNVPAYYGYLDVMFVDFQLAKYSNNIQSTQLTFEVVETGASNAPALVDTDANSPLFDDAGLTFFRGGATPAGENVYRNHLDGSGSVLIGPFVTSNGVYPVYSPGDTAVGYAPARTFDGVVRSSPGKVWRYEIGYDVYYYPDGTVGNVASQSNLPAVSTYTPLGLQTNRMSLLEFNDLYTFRTAHSSGNNLSNYVVRSLIVTARSDGIADFYNFGQDDGSGLAYAESVRNLPFMGLSTTSSAWLRFRTLDFGDVTVTYTESRLCGALMQNGKLYIMRERAYNATLGWRYDCDVFGLDDGVLITTWTGPNFLYPPLNQQYLSDIFDLFWSGGLVQVVSSAILRWSWEDSGSLIDGDLTSADGGLQSLRYVGPNYVVSTYIKDYGLASQTRVVQVTGNQIDPNPSRPLSTVFSQIGAEKLATNSSQQPIAFDYSGLPDDVACLGYVVTRQTSPQVAIDYLRDFYRVDCAQSADKIKFVLRGGTSVASLSTDELGAQEGSGEAPQAVAWTEADELGMPAIVYLKFADKDNKFEIGTAIARREATVSKEVVTLDATAVVMSANDAAVLAQLALADRRLAGEPVTFTTTYAHDALETADPIIVPGKFKNRRVRIVSRTDKGGMIEWAATRDEPAVLTQYAVGGSAGGGDRPSSDTIALAPVALTDILNLPSLRTSDDDGGAYVYISPTSAARFNGAEVFDMALTSPRNFATVSAAGFRGIATTALGTFSGADFDEGNFVDVQFPIGTMLESTTPALVSLGSNAFLIGSEIVGATTTTSLGVGIWRLSGFLRGLRGTESAIWAHSIGDRVFALNAAGLRRDSAAPLGALVIGAVSDGRDTNDLVNYSTQGTNVGQALVPFAPLFLTQGTTPSGKQFKWQRRSRKVQKTPFNPSDDEGHLYALQLSTTAAFSTSTTIQVSGEQYDTSASDLTGLGLSYYVRVAQLDGQGKPGTFSAPIAVS